MPSIEEECKLGNRRSWSRANVQRHNTLEDKIYRSLEKDACHQIKEVPYLLRSDRGGETAGKVPDT